MSGQASKYNGGGAATHGGVNYQNRVAAWFCARILAEQEAAPPWGLPQDATLEYVRCETEHPVDDLLVGTSHGGRAFIQVKHTVGSDKKENAPLASALDQFVRQFLSSGVDERTERAEERPLDANRDRLVLVASPKSSTTIKEHLPKVLARLRTLTPHLKIEDAAANAEERRVLAVVTGHLHNSWHRTAGVEMTEHDARRVLSLAHVLILDVDEEGRDEQGAKDLLRSSVVELPEQADAAWNALVLACSGYASQRGGADRTALRRELTACHIKLKASRSYRADIERLRKHSLTTLKALRDFSAIKVAEREVKIERAVSRALCAAAADERSFVVVGEPGSGKSGSLHDLVEKLMSENRDVILLAVDKLEARSLGELRQELNLEHDIADILRNWSGDQSCFLVLDAFDAARSLSAAKTFHDLLADALEESDRWRVIASIRKFDLRHNAKLQSLFAGEPPCEFRDDEFYRICHVNIPLFDAGEWIQIATQAPDLAMLFVGASSDLRVLLMVPFNVRLAGELLGGGVRIESLTPVRTQIELLDLYWRERVTRDDGEGDAREAVLARAIDKMIDTRSLRANRREVTAADPTFSRTLKDVLSSHVMSEWEPSPGVPADGSVLTFAHHMLFDYAAARLLLRGTPETLVRYLEREPDLVMAIRPSIVMHFRHEWLRGGDRFWDASSRVIKSERIPEIGKLIGPTVAVESAKELDGFDPLVRALMSADVKTREPAEKALRHVTGALLVTALSSPEKFVGEAASPCGELLDRFMQESREVIVYAVRPVLSAMCERPERLTEQQRYFAGRIARRLLEFALAHQQRDSSLVTSGQEAVCRTFESDKAASAVLLRRCLEPQHVLQFGYEELFHIGNEIERLIPLDPTIVEDIYRATFTNNDMSEDKTALLPSRIMGLTSTRNQDFDMARYALAEKYGRFLDQAPAHATRSLIAALNAYVAEHHAPRPGAEPRDESFDFDGRTAFIRTDRSEIWDAGSTYGDEHPMRMLDEFEGYLERISADEGGSRERRQILDLVAAENRTAILWRRLLMVAARAADTLGRDVRSLAWAMPVLLNDDTSRVVGDYLAVAFTSLTPDERERVERAIIAVGETANEESWMRPEYNRNRLLGCLDRGALVTDEAKAVLAQLDAEKDVPPNESLFGVEHVHMGEYTDEEYLKNSGVTVDEEQNRRIQALAKPAKAFSSRHLNSAPTLAEIREVLPSLIALHEALRTAEQDGVHEQQRHLAWGYLAESCERSSKSGDLSCETEEGAFVKATLLEASTYPHPLPRPDQDKNFENGWSTPAARVDAAQGLIRLAGRAACVDQRVLDAVACLARDEVPAVRHRIAISLDSLYHTAHDLMWKLMESISREDESRGVLKWLLTSSLRNIAPYQQDRTTELVSVIFERMSGDESSGVRKHCASIFAGLYVWQKHPACGEAINRIVGDPVRYNDEAQQIVSDLRAWLNLDAAGAPGGDNDSVRSGSFSLLERLLTAARDSFRELEAENVSTPFASWSAEDRDASADLARLADSVCTQVYFASGAYKNPSDDVAKVPLDVTSRMRYLREARPVLELLSEFGYARLTHRLLQTLEYLITFDPEGVFLLVGRVVLKGRQGGYQYESQAADLIVRLVERFIAEFRHILQENEECRRALIEMLDTFVEAGWASARRLTYRMEEIFR